MTDADTWQQLSELIQNWSQELGFAQIGITDTDLSTEHERYKHWLAKQYHGQMHWLADHQDKRLNPQLLQPGTLRVICARMNYLPGDTQQIAVLKDPRKAYISRYALGRDYHKTVRKRLAQLAERIREFAQDQAPETRAFVDSAPVMERPLAVKAGLGWTGKHTLVLNREGSWFFLGEIFTNLPLPVNNTPVPDACGTCTACLKVCPTDAFPKPYQLDARRCISYLTIENKGPIPLEFREPIGNRVFGCDDCQAICPWNKFAQFSAESDFTPRHQFESSDLLRLFLWDEDTFLKNTAGSPLRRAGYERWLRNLAVGLGNAPSDPEIQQALASRRDQVSELVREHIDWALERQGQPSRPRQRKIKNPASER